MDARPEARRPPTPDAWLPRVDRRALLIFAALVVLLLVPWPGLGRAFAAAFTVFGNALVAVAGAWPGPAPHFGLPVAGEAGVAGGGAWTVVLNGNDAAPLDTRILAYTPLAIFVALAFATPVPLRRRGIIFAVGLACLLARLAFAVLVPLSRAFGSGRSDSTLAWLAEVGWTVFVSPPVMSYATPLAAWLLGVVLTTPRRARVESRQARRSRGGRGPRKRRRS